MVPVHCAFAVEAVEAAQGAWSPVGPVGTVGRAIETSLPFEAYLKGSTERDAAASAFCFFWDSSKASADAATTLRPPSRAADSADCHQPRGCPTSPAPSTAAFSNPLCRSAAASATATSAGVDGGSTVCGCSDHLSA